MKALFVEIIYRPLFNALAWLYHNVTFGDFGVAIILLTLAIRIVLFPLFHKTVKHQRITQDIQPEIKRIQKKHKDDKELQAKEIIDLYGKHKINPLTPILALFIQLPIIFAVYKIFINGFSNGALDLLYPSIHLAENPSQTFLGFIDLTKPNMWIAVFAAVAQYFQGKLSFAKKKKTNNKEESQAPAEKFGQRLIMIMPVLTLFILSRFPAAIGIYWSTTTIFSVFQQVIVNRSLNKGEEDRVSLSDNGRDKIKNPNNT